MRSLLVPAVLALVPALCAQTASYGSFGTGCAGSIPGNCPSHNASVTTVAGTHNSNIFAHPVTPTSSMIVLGFRLFNKSVGSASVTIPTYIYKADAAGKPANPAVATSTMLVTTTAGWHVTKFLPPVVIKPNETFFISHNGSTAVTWSWDSSGTTYTHYWHSQTTTAWNGPFNSANWAFMIDCAGAGNVPVLSNTGLPKPNTKFSVDLANALPSSAAGLIIGASTTAWGPINLPLDLSPAGAAGCNLLVSFDAMLATPTDASGNGSIPLGIPNDSKLLGINFHNQYFVVDGKANALGLAWSNGGSGVIGN